MGEVRLAIVGCGTISQLVVPGYLAHPQCRITALCDPDRERAEQCAKQWGINPKIHSRYEDVLNDNEVDAVELLTPTHFHFAQTLAGLEAHDLPYDGRSSFSLWLNARDTYTGITDRDLSLIHI